MCVPSNIAWNQPKATFWMQFTSILNQSRVKTNSSNVNKHFFLVLSRKPSATVLPSTSLRKAKRIKTLRNEDDLHCCTLTWHLMMSFHLHRFRFSFYSSLGIVYLAIRTHAYFIARNHSVLMIEVFEIHIRTPKWEWTLGFALFGSTCVVYVYRTPFNSCAPSF